MKNNRIKHFAVIFIMSILLNACGGGSAPEPSPSVMPAAKEYKIGGLASGIAAGNQVVVSNNGSNNLTISNNGPFTFGNKIPFNSTYQVAIISQPQGQHCTVLAGTGSNVSSDISNVIVSCVTDSFTISGNVVGLAQWTSIEIYNNGIYVATAHNNGSFLTSTPYKQGYLITVLAKPSEQTCTVDNGFGSGVVANVTNVSIKCSANVFTLSGLVSGLKAGSKVTLLNNGADAVTISGNTNFTFSTPVVFNGGYYIQVGTQPVGSMCYVENYKRKNFDDFTSNITDINVFCLPELVPTQKPPTQETLSETVTYQVDPAHSGQLSFGRALSFPSSPAWKVSARESDAPLVAEGKVFAGGAYEMQALDLVTGTRLWSFVLNPNSQATQTPTHLAYDKGMLFALRSDGNLRALYAKTGGTKWEVNLGDFTKDGYQVYHFTSAPVVKNGIIYLTGAGVGSLVIALDQTTGSILWSSKTRVGGESSPVVTNEGVYVALSCDHNYKFHPVTGITIWETPTECYGGAQYTIAFRNGLIYSRDWGGDVSTGRIIDFATGHNVGKFQIPGFPTPTPTIPMPAVGINYGVFIQHVPEHYVINGEGHNGTVAQGMDLKNGKILWSFEGDHGISLAPILIDDTVILASKTGTMYALDARTGNRLWTGNAGDTIYGIDEFNDRQRMGIGAGNGYIVVSTDNGLTAWKVADMPIPK